MNILSVNDLSREQINELFDIADEVSRGKGTVSLKSGSTLALLFDEESTRTHVSFEAAMAHLGGTSIYIDERNSQVSRGEPLSDTARVISEYVDFIAVRMNRHDDLVEFASYSTVPVINALTHLEHPTQALADLYTIVNAKGKLKGTRIAFVGDIAQNTCNSLMLAATKMGAEMALISPKYFPPSPEYLTRAREYGVVDIYDTLEDGLKEVDVVYTDTFVSMGDEEETERRLKMFAKYQINSRAMQIADKEAKFMHPLPAHRGQEVTADVLEGSRSLVWEQARNKLLLEQAILIYLSEKSE